MKVLAWVHLYPPEHCAGAEMMLHEILLGLRDRGHEVHVMVNHTDVEDFEGVPLTAQDNRDSLGLINWADIVITHLDKTPLVISAVGNRKPLVHLVHNHRQLDYHRVTPKYAQLVVANSEWIEEAIKWPGETIVVPPPVRPSRYATTPGTKVTLINLCEEKGGRLFWEVAERMPDTQFLGVIGGYYRQIVPNPIPKNACVFDHTPEVKNVYRQTRILLCPSWYESWGRVGIEAAASGIPTIAAPTPGLMESLGDSGTFVTLDADKWVDAIRELSDPAVYREKSEAALRRSHELEPDPYIDLLEDHMTRIVAVWRERY